MIKSLNDDEKDELSRRLSDMFTFRLPELPYIGPPGANGMVVPLRPSKIPGFAAASQLIPQEFGLANEDNQWLENLRVTGEYLETSHNGTHYEQRFGKVCYDLGVVNVVAEIPGFGEILAADYANKASQNYVDEMIEDLVDLDMETEFSLELRLRGGYGSKTGMVESSPYPGRYGVGLLQENLPPENRGSTNPLRAIETRQNSKRPLWTYKFYGGHQVQIVNLRWYGFKLRD